MRMPRSLIALLPLMPLLVACGGGGGGSTFPHQPPGTSATISNLRMSPTTVLQGQGGGWDFVEVTVDFSDPEGDVDHMAAQVRDSSGGLLYVTGASVDHVLGQTTGEARGEVEINTETVGEFTLRVWLTDQSIRASNQLEIAFRVIAPAAMAMESMSKQRSDYGVAETNGKLYVVGGRLLTPDHEPARPIADVRVYDPKDHSWSEGVPLPIPLASAAVTSAGRKIHVAGGQSLDGRAASSVFTFDVESGLWHRRPSLPYALHSAAAVAVGDSVYIIGGEAPGVAFDSVLRFDKDRNTWSAVSQLSSTRVRPCAAFMDGNIVVFGGTQGPSTRQRDDLRSIEVYDPELDLWTRAGRQPSPDDLPALKRYSRDCRP